MELSATVPPMGSMQNGMKKKKAGADLFLAQTVD